MRAARSTSRARTACTALSTSSPPSGRMNNPAAPSATACAPDATRSGAASAKIVAPDATTLMW